MVASAGVIVIALLLDYWLGEPRRGHPVVLFGGLVARVEVRWNREPRSVVRGAIAACLLLVPVTLLAWVVSALLSGVPLLAVESVALWLCLSLRGLAEHGRAVRAPLERRDLEGARLAVGRIVSRDTRSLDETGVATAATESMLENGADAVFASLFWFLLAGLPGVLLHRMVNTLDAMWGYRSERFNRFGRFAARLDDVMNYLPARLTALTYALVGRTADGIRCWREQGQRWESPNAGPVMAAGAGALHVNLGGPAPYNEGMRERPRLGVGPFASAATIGAAIGLVYRGVALWVVAVLLLAVAG